MTVAQVGEIELDYERSGSGPPLLLIMGMSGTALHWGEPFLQALREDFEVVTYDHRGVGASSRLQGPITIRELADDAVGLLSALGIDAAHVLGFSMGGMAAQELALNYLDRLLTLTLAGTYCGGADSHPLGEEIMRRGAEARATGNRELAMRASWEMNVSPRFATDTEAWERYVAIGTRRRVALSVIAYQMQAISAHDTRERLQEVTHPTLVLHGARDQVLDVANGRMIAQLIPDARLEIFDDAGHMFFWEHPQRAAELVHEHVAVHA